MAVPKKGWRKLTVDNRHFYWRTIGTDWGITLVVVTDAAFVSGKAAQQLKVNFDYDHYRTQVAVGVTTLRQQAAITPKIVRLAIERAMAMDPPFTGEIGAEVMLLAQEILQELQQEARTTSS